MTSRFLYATNKPASKAQQAGPDQKISLEQRLKEIEKQLECPLAKGKLYLSVIIGDASKKRQIVADCPAKAALVKRTGDKRVHQSHVESVCCSTDYESSCEYFKRFFKR